MEYPPYGYDRDYGYIHTVAHKCLCSGKSNIEFRKSRSMIPPQYLNVRATDFKWDVYDKNNVDPIKKIVNDFIINFRDYEKQSYGLFLYSRTKGSGKTMLSCVIANELIERYAISVKFTTVLDFLDMIRKNYKNDDYSEDIEALFKSRLLILDDIGIEKKSEHTDMKLYQLINERCSNNLVTIFTSNLSINELKLDERIIDRVNKMAVTLDIPEVPVRRIKVDEEKRKFLNRKVTT